MSNSPLNPAQARKQREYSSRGLLGIGVPQANPVVEPEFAALMPPHVGLLATRLQGSRSDSRSRLIDYLTNLDESLAQFDVAPLDAFGFACTGSTYLVGNDEERKATQTLSEKFGYPIITAAQAIRMALDHLGIRKVALLAPYPQWMVDLSHSYWNDVGLTVVDAARTMLDTNDTRNVYDVRTSMVLDACATLNHADADAILLTGTGMPTLRAILELAKTHGKPVLSSNLCLSWALLRSIGAKYAEPRPDHNEVLLGNWADKAARL